MKVQILMWQGIIKDSKWLHITEIEEGVTVGDILKEAGVEFLQIDQVNPIRGFEPLLKQHHRDWKDWWEDWLKMNTLLLYRQISWKNELVLVQPTLGHAGPAVSDWKNGTKEVLKANTVIFEKTYGLLIPIITK